MGPKSNSSFHGTSVRWQGVLRYCLEVVVQFRWLHGIFLSLPCLFIHIYIHIHIYIYIFDKEEIVVPIPEKGIWRYGTDKKVVAMLKELMRASVSGMNIFLTLFF